MLKSYILKQCHHGGLYKNKDDMLLFFKLFFGEEWDYEILWYT